MKRDGRILQTLVVALVIGVCAATADAQPADGPPSETLAMAMRLYQQERYADARPLFAAAAAGTTSDAPAGRQRGEFFLGKTLYHLRLYRESLGAFDRITRAGAAHMYFAPTLQWLTQLHPRVGPRLEPTVIQCVGRYDERAVAMLDTPETREVLATARYLLGRARYQQRRYAESLRLLDAVPPNARVSLAAQRWAARARATVGPQVNPPVHEPATPRR